MSFDRTLFVSHSFSGIACRKPKRLLAVVLAVVLAVAMLFVSPVLAQIQFLGAQSTVPATGLTGPFGAAVDSSANLYISDTGNNRILKITTAGIQSVVSLAPLSVGSPQGLAFDKTGNLYISDLSNNRVVKVPAAGGSATVFASVTTPHGLAVDANGNVFVVDEEDSKIVKISSGGATSNFETGLTAPVAVAVDTSGNVYLGDGSLSSVVKYPAAGGAGSNVGSSLTGISGVAVDRAGNVYAAESGEGAVIAEITPLGAQSTLATNGLFSAGYLAVDSNYDLLIPDPLNSQVIEFSTISVPLGFANVCQGSAPSPCTQIATLQFQTGEDGIAGISLVTTGDGNLDFNQGDGTTCSGSTSPCVVQVIFRPTQPGMRTGAVLVTDSDSGQITSVPIYGTGNAAEVGFMPALTSPPFGTDGFQYPLAVAVSGNGIFGEQLTVFIADKAACVIWVTGPEDFELYAGTGTCGYSGDGGSATSATLGHPRDVALDGAGNVYIADGANGVIRKVDRNGIITTVAGDNERNPGFSGDGGLATNAAMNSPSGVALDTAGNLYIADTNNNRIRKVDLAGIITTVAGSAQSGYAGDGGPATIARLTTPFGVRADAAGNLFIADSGNNVIRRVDLTGTITTVAGNFGLGAGYSGDGGPATNAQLALPHFVSVDAAEQLFIADSQNNVIRRVDGSGTITTFAVPTVSPADLVVDPTGNLAMVDPVEEALTLVVRTIPNGNDFGNQNINTSSTAQNDTVTNIGNQTLTFSAIAPPTGFNLSGPNTSCATASPLNIGLDCILGIVFDPATAGAFEDVVTLTDNSLGPAASSSQTIGVTGTGVQPLTNTTTTLTASPTTAFTGQTVTLTATITPTPTGGTLGTVDFCLGGSPPDIRRPLRQSPLTSLRRWRSHSAMTPQEPASCGSGTLLETIAVAANGTAILTITNLPVGINSITAVYSGNPALNTSTSSPVTVTINPAATTTTTLTISPNPGFAGQSVTLTGTVAPTPTGSSLGTITFCDAGNPTLNSRRNTAQSNISTRHALGHSHLPNGSSGPCGVDTPLGTANLTAQGTATLALTTLAVGDHSIYAVYSGTVGFSGSVSDSIDEGVDPSYTVTAPQTPFTVGQGGSVTVNVTVPPLGGSFDNVVTMSASGLPGGATATFNPPTVTPGAVGAPTVLTIQLLSLTTAGLTTPTEPSVPFGPLSATFALGCAVFLYRPPTRIYAKRALMFAAVSLVAMLMAACNGGFGAKPGTIPGNYVVTITGTSGSLHPSTTITIDVQ